MRLYQVSTYVLVRLLDIVANFMFIMMSFWHVLLPFTWLPGDLEVSTEAQYTGTEFEPTAQLTV